MTTRTRAPRGVPTGGQFLAESRSDSGVVDAVPGQMTDEELLAFTQKRGRIIAAQAGPFSGAYLDGVGGDADDHGQELALRMLAARRRQGADLVSDEPVKPVNEAMYGTMVSKFLLNITRTGRLRYEDRQGMVELNRRAAEAEEILGRALTSSERDDLAEEVRNSFPPGRRPTKGFQTRIRETSFDPMAGADHEGDGAHMLRHVEAVLRRDHDIQTSDGHESDEADRLIELADSGNRAAAKQQVWSAMGAPMPQTHIFNDGKASALRKQIAAFGGAAQVARRFSDGLSSVDDDLVLFAPWGDGLSVDDKYAIADAIVARPSYSDELFSAAVSSATSPRKKKETDA